MTLKVLALSGSLRRDSINSALLRTAARLAPATMRVEVFQGVRNLPLFNIDLEEEVPSTVLALRRAAATADALLIASPEYAHGVSGVMKNTLDWLVSVEAMLEKPVALLNAQPRATISDAALRETLRTMSMTIVEEASVAIPLLADSLSEGGMLRSDAVKKLVSQALLDLEKGICKGCGG